MARRATVAALAASLLLVSGAGGVPAQTPKRGGTVVIAVGAVNDPVCFRVWDPVCARTLTRWPNEVLAQAFGPGPATWRPELVEDYDLELDPFAVIYHVGREARWSDGVRVSARDFVFAYETFLKYGDIAADDPFRTVIRRVEAVDARTVRFAFRARYGDWRALLAFPPLPRHALAGENLREVWQDGIDDPKTRRPLGSGPFLIESRDRGEHVVLRRNPRYGGPHPAYVDRVVLRFLPAAAFYAAVRSGDADIANVLRPPQADEQAETGISVIPWADAFWEHFDFRVGPGGNPALRNKLVRRALAYGIDRVALVRAIYAELEPPPLPLDSVFFVPEERSYRPNWRTYRPRVRGARRLLDAAGCRPAADGIRVCERGVELRLRFVTSPAAQGLDLRRRALELVQKQLLAVGVEARPQYAPSAAFFDQILAEGDFDVALFGWAKTGPEATDSPYRCGDHQNYTGYCSRLFTGDLNELELIVDPARRAAVANRADRRLARDIPVLPLYQRQRTTFVRSELRGFATNGFDSFMWNAEDWWLAR